MRKKLKSKHRVLGRRMTQKELKSRIEKIKKRKEVVSYGKDNNAIYERTFSSTK